MVKLAATRSQRRWFQYSGKSTVAIGNAGFHLRFRLAQNPLLVLLIRHSFPEPSRLGYRHPYSVLSFIRGWSEHNVVSKLIVYGNGLGKQGESVVWTVRGACVCKRLSGPDFRFIEPRKCRQLGYLNGRRAARADRSSKDASIRAYAFSLPPALGIRSGIDRSGPSGHL